MKLRNKKTGEIKPAEAREDGIYLYDETTEQWYKYELDLLAKWWEYYEERKWNWYIDWDGEIKQCDNRVDALLKFETKEEAELAVERLKAFKRLKDKGFRFDGYDVANRGGDNVICGQVYFKAGNYDREEIVADLDLLFGGEK